MSARKAYIGLSSPLGYDYEFEPELGHPNPVLEAPLGLFLLYDEIWFLRPELCPKNMRDLDYVKFISESEDLTDYREQFDQLSTEDIFEEGRITGDMPWEDWDKRIATIAPFATYDNHGRAFPEVEATPNVSPGNFLFDYFVTSERKTDLEYITNSSIRSQISTRTAGTPIHDYVETAEQILAERIPNYQSPEGPYFEEIDDYRKFDRRTKFRDKIMEVDPSADDIRRELERVKARMTNLSTRKKNVYDSIMIGVMGSLPGVSKFIGPILRGKKVSTDYARYQKYGWAGFLARIEEEQQSRNQ